jgi:hypothetical protein
MKLSERLAAAEAGRLAARLAETDRSAAQLPTGYSWNGCSCCRSSQQQAAAGRAARQRLWQSPAARDLGRAAEWTAALLGTLAVLLLASITF